MEIFRTIGVFEFFHLLLGEKIVRKTQSSCYCYEITNEKEIISMDILHKSCCCGFLEPLFFVGRDNEKILLKLDIPMEKTTYGCGDCFPLCAIITLMGKIVSYAVHMVWTDFSKE